MSTPLHRPVNPPTHQRRGRLALLGFLAIAAFFLATEHTAHLFGWLPFLLLLLCPFLHLFMHAGHGDHSRSGTDGAGGGHDHGGRATSRRSPGGRS